MLFLKADDTQAVGGQQLSFTAADLQHLEPYVEYGARTF